MAQTVFLHVGVAKTGTSYLQRVLSTNRAGLRAAGTLYPGRSAHAHFQAALDLRGGTFQGHTYPKAAGTWRALAAEVDRFGGNALISHEFLARIRKESLVQAVGAFGTDDVRVVITARDLGRQLPAVWQENVKNRNEETYGFFLRAVLERPPAGEDTDQAARRAAKFWRAQDVAGVSERWSKLVGPEAVTIVTVPHPGAEREELWTRFAAACNLPALDIELPLERENQSMGAIESEVLRRMNARFPQNLPWPRYEALVKRTFAIKILAASRSHGALVVPAAWREATRQAAEKQVAGLAAARYRVVGHLDELLPQFRDSAERSPDDFTEGELLAATLELLARAAVTEPHLGQRPSWAASAAHLVRRLARRA